MRGKHLGKAQKRVPLSAISLIYLVPSAPEEPLDRRGSHRRGGVFRHLPRTFHFCSLLFSLDSPGWLRFSPLSGFSSLSRAERSCSWRLVRPRSIFLLGDSRNISAVRMTSSHMKSGHSNVIRWYWDCTTVLVIYRESSGQQKFLM